MAEYKQPKTRIRKVEDGFGVKYFPEYRVVLIPRILWSWEPILGKIDNPEYTETCYEAEWRVDGFLFQRRHSWHMGREYGQKKKVKRKTTIIEYPQEGW